MKNLLLITILLVFQSVIAQDYKYGKVSEAELLETTNADYPDANATILYHNQQLDFRYVQGQGFIQTNTIHERIKIYNKEGFDEATKLIRFYNNSEGASSNNEKVTSLKGITYNLEGNDIVEYKLKKEGIFDEETNKYWKTTKFTMPNIKEGCVIEFSYIIESNNVGIDDIEFQKLIPIRKLDFKLTTPEYYNYKKLLNPRASFVPKLTTSQNNASVIITSKERTGAAITQTNFDTSKINYKENIISADLKNIPPLNDENFIDNLNNYQAKLIMEMEYVKWPNEPINYYSTTWEKVTQNIYKDVDFGNQLNKTGYYNDEVDALLSGTKDPNEKMELLFNFVKSKVKWNGYNGYTAETGVAKAYKEGTGNVADINLMLISMLRYAGLKSNPILLSTKSNGIPLLPTRTGFNYVVCAVENPDGLILLDASQKFSTHNILPLKSLNWLGRLIREDQTSEWINLVPENLSKENISMMIEINEDLSANGKIRNNFTDYNAMRYREKFENFNMEQLAGHIEKNHVNLEVTNLAIDNLYNPNQSLTQSYEFKLDDAVELIGDKLYFSPLLFLFDSENPFKENTREYPIDFVYPTADKYMVNIKVPDGYGVESMPVSSKIKFKDSEGEFIFLSSQNGDYLQFIITVEIKSSLILADDYVGFKEFYQMMIEKQTEKIVLKKV